MPTMMFFMTLLAVIISAAALRLGEKPTVIPPNRHWYMLKYYNDGVCKEPTPLPLHGAQDPSEPGFAQAYAWATTDRNASDFGCESIPCRPVGGGVFMKPDCASFSRLAPTFTLETPGPAGPFCGGCNRAENGTYYPDHCDYNYSNVIKNLPLTLSYLQADSEDGRCLLLPDGSGRRYAADFDWGTPVAWGLTVAVFAPGNEVCGRSSYQREIILRAPNAGWCVNRPKEYLYFHREKLTEKPPVNRNSNN